MICNVKDIPIYYEQHGKGVPILCIHGYSIDHRVMYGCLEPVFSQISGYRRIYLDLPGMGKSPAPPWLKNADDMLDTLSDFIEKVIGDETFLVIAQSYGGYLAQGLIHRMKHQIDGVFLLCPVVEADFNKRTLPEHHCLYKDAGFSASDEFLQIAVAATSRVYELYHRDIAPGIKAADDSFTARYRIDGYALSFDDALRNLYFNKPAAILTGRQDAVTGYCDAISLLESFPRATFAVLDCAGHNLQMENEALFAAHISDWLRRISYED